MIEKFRQSRNYRILDEILSAMTHGFGVALSIAGLVLIILRGVEVGGAMRITAFSIYGSILVLFYLASTLFTVWHSPRPKVFQIFIIQRFIY